MIDVTNETNTSINPERIVNLGEFVLRRLNVSEEAELAILFVDEATITELHVTWMDEPGPTDVLSFPMDELRPGEEDAPTPPGLLGDVVVCPSVASRQAVVAGHSFETEVFILVIHGILHLLGYDHREKAEEKKMFDLQGELLLSFLTSTSEG
jgi:probable rRNA maturation factor